MSLRNMSLRRKLPLLVSGLTGAALLAAGALAYLEVRRAAVTAAEARLSSVVSELSALTVATQAARVELEQRVAAAPEITAALGGQPFDSARLSGILDTLRTPNDAGMPVSIVRRDGSTVFTTGAFEPSSDPDPSPPLLDERTTGPFRSIDGRIVYWVTIPLPGPRDEAAGWIVQRRDLGNVRATGTALGALIGGGTRLLVGAENDSVWVDLSSGRTLSMPMDGVVIGEPYRFRDSEAGQMLAVAGPLPEVTRLVQADMAMAAVLERPRAFRSNALVLGAALTALAVLIAWVSSGGLTGPLQSLVSAADAMAAGNYRRRVTPVSDDELGRLGRAFNAMAERVATSDEALRAKLEEVQALATRLEQANVEAERARAEAQEASRVKSEFLAVMSHEIRTPINVVVSYVDLLKAGVPDEPTEKQRHYLERIDQSSQLLIWLLNDLLDFSRIESGQMQVEMAVGSARTAIESAKSAFQVFADGKGISLTSQCDADPEFYADGQRVQQIVLNLLSNAIKFTPRGGSVSVGCSESRVGAPGMEATDGPWIRIDVSDTGVGIPEEQIAQMFEPFVRGDSEQTGGASGAGLGLAISRRLAEMMSGAVTVESERGRGTEFTLWLRAASSAVPAARDAGHVPSPLDAAGRSRALSRRVDESEAVPPRI
jgi:signal transduction histidine kinase